jgi:hypothetical protein
VVVCVDFAGKSCIFDRYVSPPVCRSYGGYQRIGCSSSSVEMHRRRTQRRTSLSTWPTSNHNHPSIPRPLHPSRARLLHPYRVAGWTDHSQILYPSHQRVHPSLPHRHVLSIKTPPRPSCAAETTTPAPLPYVPNPADPTRSLPSRYRAPTRSVLGRCWACRGLC